MIEKPQPLTWARWRKLAFSELSLMRSMQYERLEQAACPGPVLDIGGTKGARYHVLLQESPAVTTLNISDAAHITSDVNHPLPLESESFGSIICLNTMQYIKNDVAALKEFMRVLRPGGVMHLFVPWVFPTDSKGGELLRRSCYFWEDAFLSLGVAREQVHIVPLVWDNVSTGYQMVQFSLKAADRLLRPLCMGLGVLMSKVYSPEHAFADYALGYHIHFVKP